MQDIIYKIDDWTIIKLLGGIVVAITAVIGFFSKYILTKLTQSSQHSYNSDIEQMKGDINKNNGLLTSLIQNHFSTSQKILDKKIHAYELLWKATLKLKDNFPSGISLVYQMLVDSEISKANAYEMLSNNPKLGPVLSSYSLDTEMKKIIDNGKFHIEHRPFLSDNSFKLFYIYQGTLGRITHKFIWDFQKQKLYNWKQDSTLLELIKTSLTEKELAYIMNMQISALNTLLELIEYKILQDLRLSLSIKDSPIDTVEYLKDIEALLKKKST